MLTGKAESKVLGVRVAVREVWEFRELLRWCSWIMENRGEEKD